MPPARLKRAVIDPLREIEQEGLGTEGRKGGGGGAGGGGEEGAAGLGDKGAVAGRTRGGGVDQIGRASCRERV